MKIGLYFVLGPLMGGPQCRMSNLKKKLECNVSCRNSCNLHVDFRIL